MKKILFSLLTLFLCSGIVSAAELNVLSIDVKNEGSTISYSGTTDEGMLAVSCTLVDESDTQVGFKSSQVTDDATFKDTLTVESDGTYTLRCANYDGGDFVSQTIEVDTNLDNPTTGDNILIYATLGIISILGIALVFKAIKKQK